MERINQLLHHPNFVKNLNRLEALEADRIYCHHGLSHLLDVARIACLLQYKNVLENLQKTSSQPTLSTEGNRTLPPVDTLPDEIIYAAALLHDIGRVLQYEQGLPHETAGLPLAGQILKECGFTETEQSLILDAIQFHRKDISDNTKDTDNGTGDVQSLRTLLHKADKMSRNCFACMASGTCYWPENKKNQGILY